MSMLVLNSPTDSESSNSEKGCAVCGCPNARNNFGTLSCNACAAFFRRTLIQERKYICQCSSSEDEDGTTSSIEKGIRECKYCRFQKCIQVGMQEKSIRSIDVWKWRTEMSKAQEWTPKPKQQNKRSKYARNLSKDEAANKNEVLLYSEDLYEIQLLANFLNAESKMKRIHNSRTEMSREYMNRYGQTDDLIRGNENLLSNVDQFLDELPPTFNREFLSKIEHCWSIKPTTYIRDLLISIGFGKSLPIFGQLDFNDQRILLRSQTLSALDLFVSFYSFQKGFEVLIAPNHFPIIELFRLKRYEKDPIVSKLAFKVYCHTMKQMLGVRPTREEFAYLMALMFTNSAVTGLSINAQQLLATEAEKYSRALLRLQQRKFGDAKGALRYSETLLLIGQSILNAKRHRELVVYLDLMHDQGRFEEFMPKAFLPFCIMGPCELPQFLP